MELAAVIISGIFSLAGVILTHQLNARAAARLQQRTPAASQPATPPSHATRPQEYEDPPNDSHVAARPPTTTASPFRVPLLLWLSVFPYTIFAVLLLQSGGSEDAKSGYMFLGNSIFLAIGCIVATAAYSKSHLVGFIAAAIQIGILIAMMAQGIGDTIIVVPMNLAIAAVFAGIGFYYFRKTRK